MSDLHDIIAYIIANYPESLAHELSNARLTKMVYLADWYNCINNGEQISSIKWYFDSYGPFVWDVKETAERHSELFKVTVVPNMHGSKKRQFTLRNKSYRPQLGSLQKKSIDHIIDVTKKLYWADFIKLVYSTHPIASSERYTYLDLAKLAKDYSAISMERPNTR